MTDGHCPAGHSANISTPAPGRHRAPARPRPTRIRQRSLPARAKVPVASTPSFAEAITAPRLPLVELFGFDDAPEWVADDDLYPAIPHESDSPSTGTASAAPTPNRRPTTVKRSPVSKRTNLFDLIPRLSDIGAVDDEDNTGTLVQRLWDATDGIEAIDESWTGTPRRQATGLSSPDRPWRRIAGVAIGIVVVVIAATAFAGSDVAVVDRSPALDAVQAADATVVDMREMAALLANPIAAGADLSDATVKLTTIDRAARDLSTSASSLGQDAELRSSAAMLINSADLAFQIESRLGDALSYRLISRSTFVLPELPVQADAVTSSEVGFELASMLADTERSIERLPRDAALANHRVESVSLLEEATLLVDQYLAALRNGETGNARSSANELSTAIGLHQEALTQSFARFKVEIDASTLEFSDLLDTTASSLAG